MEAGGNEMDIAGIVKNQRDYFNTGETKPYGFRIDALKRLSDAIEGNERKIFDALKADLGKSDFEGYMTEVGLVKDELKHTIRRLKKWMRPQRRKTPFAHFPSKSRVYAGPYGVALIMSPWNYPFQLTMTPLIGAIAAGNCAVVKPSNYSPETSDVITEIVNGCFDAKYVETVLGGRQQNGDLLNQKFDYIFFTGGITVGKLVMESASKNLTPIMLELGGKSPCIVDETAKVELAAKRIAFGKFINSGQTCVAPDYIYVHSSRKDELVKYLIEYIKKFYGGDILNNPDYPHIINDKHFQRIMGLKEGANVIWGGEGDARARKIHPTLLDGVNWDSPVMGEEIFGPLLPILTFDRLDEVIDGMRSRHRPLSLYLFTEDDAVKKRVIDSVEYGGGCINDTIIHVATPYIPFGGVGHSGMGSYHGKQSFDTFTHYKGVLEKSSRIDLELRYQPATEKKFRSVRRFLG